MYVRWSGLFLTYKNEHFYSTHLLISVMPNEYLTEHKKSWITRKKKTWLTGQYDNVKYEQRKMLQP